MKRPHCLSLVVVGVLVAFAVPGVRSQAPAGPDTRALYTKTEHMVPMRDGVKLFTIVYAPKDQARPYPFMLHRTPYGSPPYGPDAIGRRSGRRRLSRARGSSSSIRMCAGSSGPRASSS